MSRHRFIIDNPERVYEALVVAGEAAREDIGVEFDVGPWDDQELREKGWIEVSNDDGAEIVAARFIDADLGFEED